MSLTITYPQYDGDNFPGNEPAPLQPWTAKVTYEVNDAVDGILWDLNTNEVYPSQSPPLPTSSGGIYTWQVPFQPLSDQNINLGDPLMVYCYDAETEDDGDTRSATADQVGRPSEGHCRDRVNSITIDSASLSAGDLTVPVQATLTKGVQGCLILLCANLQGRKITKRLVRTHPLPPASDNAKRHHTFQGIDPMQWTHICVVGVIKKHQGGPASKPLKP